MNMWCALGIHDYKRVGLVMPLRGNDAFDISYRGHFAAAECRRCGKLSVKQFHQRSFSWYSCDELTEKEYLENFKRIAGHNIEEDNRIRYYKSVTLEGKEVYYFTLYNVKYIFY